MDRMNRRRPPNLLELRELDGQKHGRKMEGPDLYPAYLVHPVFESISHMG